MGMFNTIYADLTCAFTGKTLPGTPIQIKWQDHKCLWLGVYKVGDMLERLEPGFDNTWVKTEFICDACSRHETGWQGKPYIPTAGQVWHPAYVEIRESRICRVLNETEFTAIGVKKFAVD